LSFLENKDREAPRKSDKEILSAHSRLNRQGTEERRSKLFEGIASFFELQVLGSCFKVKIVVRKL
jgi:hypothetical protein